MSATDQYLKGWADASDSRANEIRSLKIECESYRAMGLKLLEAYIGSIDSAMWQMGKEYLTKEMIERDQLVKEARKALEGK